MGANTLTGLLPTIYDALQVVSREMVGFIPAVTRNTSSERAALGQQILVPITTQQTLADNTPGVTPPDTGDQTINSVPMTITKSKHVPIRWNGEQQLGVRNAGTYEGILKNQFMQAFRSLTNQIEIDLFTVCYQSASRAYGTAGSTPLGVAGDLSDIAQTRKILDDNGAPQSDLQMVLGSSAVANLRGKQNMLLKVNEAGSDDLLRTGTIYTLPVEGFWLHNSNAIQQITKGTGSGYTLNGTVAQGVTSAVVQAGTGTINAGDIINIAGDTNNYVVTAGVSAPGTIGISVPGFLTSEASGSALTIGANYTPNVAFSKSAVQLIARPPAVPLDPGGQSMDAAIDSILVEDPVSGLVFEVAAYREFLQMVYHVRLAWGVAVTQGNHVSVLRG